MPELPEVETVRQILKTQILGLTIKKVNVFYNKVLENVDEESFVRKLTNEEFVDINRMGKYLIFLFKHHAMVVHLRMEGKFYFKNQSDYLSKHEHIEFVLDNGKVLRYHDTRKFGRFVLLNTTDLQEIKKYPSLSKLGPDGNTDVDADIVYNALKSQKTSIKAALLDQTIIAGLGNIYVDEVCFMAKLHPELPCNKLSLDDCKNIVEASKDVLNKAIALGGTTIRSYTSSLGVTGRFQNELLVHSKENEPCPICGTTIKKIRVVGRGTYYCPKCQKKSTEPKIIGVTGLIASGKTAVTDYLKELGYPIIDCDEINRSIMTKGDPSFTALFKKLKEHFPTVCNNEEIDRKALRELIFNDEDKRHELETIVYEIIKKIIIKQIKKEKNDIILYTKEAPLIFLSAPLLIESGFDKYCDEILFVSTNQNIQLTRIMKRDNVSELQALNAVKIRKTLDELINVTNKKTHIIENNQGLDVLHQNIDQFLKNILED